MLSRRKRTAGVLVVIGLVLTGAVLLVWSAPRYAAAQRAPGRPASATPVYRPPPGDLPAQGLRSDQVALLRRTLSAAPSHGLAEAYLPADLDQRLASRDPVVRLDGERRLALGAIRYAQAMRGGRLAPDAFRADWSLHPEPFDAAGEYQTALVRNQLSAWIEDLPPPYAGYADLQQGLATYRRIEAAGGWPTLGAGLILKLGVVDGRVPVLRARLAAEDRSVSPVGGAAFDSGLAEGVMRAQKRFGLEPTGIVDTATRLALNTSVEDRIGQIVANMERWRWLPARLPADRI